MSNYSRDNSIYGHHLIPFVLLAKPPEDPMQHIEDLKSDLKFAEEASGTKGEAFVPTSQETVRKVLADLEELQTLRARLAQLEVPPAQPEEMPTSTGFYWYDAVPNQEGFHLVEVYRPLWVDRERQDLAWRYLDRSCPEEGDTHHLVNCKGRFIAVAPPSAAPSSLSAQGGAAEEWAKMEQDLWALRQKVLGAGMGDPWDGEELEHGYVCPVPQGFEQEVEKFDKMHSQQIADINECLEVISELAMRCRPTPPNAAPEASK